MCKCVYDGCFILVMLIHMNGMRDVCCISFKKLLKHHGSRQKHIIIQLYIYIWTYNPSMRIILRPSLASLPERNIRPSFSSVKT